jgi:hypothetical protein
MGEWPVSAIQRCAPARATVNGIGLSRSPYSDPEHPPSVEDAMAESEDGSDPLRGRIIDTALALAEEDAG